MAHALARTPFGFGVARFALGLGEAGNFPAAIKTVAEWFPRSERALATGIFNARHQRRRDHRPRRRALDRAHLELAVGVRHHRRDRLALAVLLVAASTARRRSHPRLSAGGAGATSAAIRRGAGRRRFPGLRLVAHRQTWAFAIGKFLTDPVWWFYLFWFPKFLNENHGLTLSKLGPPLITIYLVADVGSIGGGWLSSHLIKRGWTVNAARKTAMLVCALCVVPIVFASR